MMISDGLLRQFAPETALAPVRDAANNPWFQLLAWISVTYKIYEVEEKLKTTDRRIDTPRI